MPRCCSTQWSELYLHRSLLPVCRQVDYALSANNDSISGVAKRYKPPQLHLRVVIGEWQLSRSLRRLSLMAASSALVISCILSLVMCCIVQPACAAV